MIAARRWLLLSTSLLRIAQVGEVAPVLRGFRGTEHHRLTNNDAGYRSATIT
jgi:hypothetical protein